MESPKVMDWMESPKVSWSDPVSRAMIAGALDMASVSVQIVLSSDQTRLQKELIPGPGQLPHFKQRELGLGQEFRPIVISTMQNSAGLGSVLVIQPVHKNIHITND